MAFRFDPIDLTTYPRREHFEHFFPMRLTFSTTVMIDVSDLRLALKNRGYRAYLAQIWLLSETVMRVPEFRMSVDPNGRLGLFDRLDPLYTIFNETSKTFSSIWTPHDADFRKFHDAAASDIERFNTGRYTPQGELPINVLNVSSIPWLDFASFNLNLPSDYTLPIFTIGRYTESHGCTRMPLAIQVHHAVCDGFHLGVFVEELRQLIADWPRWLPESRVAGA